jgi:tetratricopeptide (TPR) repeat protein
MDKQIIHRPVLNVLLVLLFSLLAYSATLYFPFHFDDEPGITENLIIRDLRYFIEPSKAKDFKGPFGYNALKMRYITLLTFALNYRIHGLDVTGYHILNIMIHIITAMLVYLFVTQTFNTPFLRGSPLRDYSCHIALFTALLFACHPLQTQAVTYIWQRATSLSTMFYLISLTAYIKWRLGILLPSASMPSPLLSNIKSLSLYSGCIIAAILAMKTKETAFMLPVTVAIYEFIFFEGKIKKRIICLIPLLLTLFIIPLTLATIHKAPGEIIGVVSDAARGNTDLPRHVYLLTELRVLLTYIRLIFLPVHQNLDYDYPVYRSFFNIEVLLSFLFLVSLLGLGIYLFSRFRHSAPTARIISFGILWFFINLMLESSIIPLNNVIFEHRMYQPSIGVFFALTSSVFMASGIMRARRKGTETAVIVILLIITSALTWTAYARNNIWKNEVSLWQDVVKKSPGNKRAHNNLGSAYKYSGLFDDAIRHYRTAIELDPGYAYAHNNLGSAYQLKGMPDKAIQHYRAAIKLDPLFSDAHNKLGSAYQSKGLIEKAIEHYQTAANIYPNYRDPNINLGIAYQSVGQLDKAVRHYKTVIRLDPMNAGIHFNLGTVYQSQGRMEKAIQHYSIATEIDPEYTDAHNNLGIVYQLQGDIDRAIKQYLIAVRLDPYYVKAHKNLGIAYRIKGMTDKAREHSRIAESLGRE